MKHQQFENWILLSQDLEQEQQRELQSHLKQCSDCTALYQAVHQIDHLFNTAPAPDPAPQFSARWLIRLKKAEQRRNRMILGTSFGLITLATVLLLSSIGLEFNTVVAGFPQMLLEMVTLVANWIVFINQISDVIAPLFRISVKLISPVWLYTLGLSLTGITAAWIYAVTRSRSLHKEIQS
jgi:hypothetical protein